jgi:hypothetical protein
MLGDAPVHPLHDVDQCLTDHEDVIHGSNLSGCPADRATGAARCAPSPASGGPGAGARTAAEHDEPVTSPTPPPADPVELAPETGEAASGRRSGGAGDMVRSMLVVLAVVAGLVLLVPRPERVSQPSVDVASAAAGAAAEAGFALSVPQGLPAGWQATSARLQRGTDGVATWHVGYVTPSGQFAGFEQAGDPTPAWEDTQVTDGRPAGTVRVAGQDWIVRSRTDRGITSWVLRGPDRTTIVTGTAGPADLSRLAGSLQLT